jgi:hypothetical protein
VYQHITQFKEIGNYPEIKQFWKKFQLINERIKELTLETYQANNIGSAHLEKEIEENYRIHIPRNRIYHALLFHGLMGIYMKKRHQRKCPV